MAQRLKNLRRLEFLFYLVFPHIPRIADSSFLIFGYVMTGSAVDEVARLLLTGCHFEERVRALCASLLIFRCLPVS